jgi:hypothetical protein
MKQQRNARNFVELYAGAIRLYDLGAAGCPVVAIMLSLTLPLPRNLIGVSDVICAAYVSVAESDVRKYSAPCAGPGS